MNDCWGMVITNGLRVVKSTFPTGFCDNLVLFLLKFPRFLARYHTAHCPRTPFLPEAKAPPVDRAVVPS